MHVETTGRLTLTDVDTMVGACVAGTGIAQVLALSVEHLIANGDFRCLVRKVGRVRTCKLGPRRLEEEVAWIERYRQLWDARFDELDKVVEELKRKEKVDGRKQRE
jgi:hypothetical protein